MLGLYVETGLQRTSKAVGCRTDRQRDSVVRDLILRNLRLRLVQQAEAPRDRDRLCSIPRLKPHENRFHMTFDRARTDAQVCREDRKSVV